MKTTDTQFSAMPAPVRPARITVIPFDPWPPDELALTDSERAALPEVARAPQEWFAIPPSMGAYLAGLGIVVLSEVGPPPDRVGRAASLFGVAFRGTHDPEAVGGEHRALAERFFVEDPAARESWRHAFQAFRRMSFVNTNDLIRHMLTKLEASQGLVATLRARYEQLGAILARLEKPGGPA